MFDNDKDEVEKAFIKICDILQFMDLDHVRYILDKVRKRAFFPEDYEK